MRARRICERRGRVKVTRRAAEHKIEHAVAQIAP